MLIYKEIIIMYISKNHVDVKYVYLICDFELDLLLQLYCMQSNNKTFAMSPLTAQVMVTWICMDGASRAL